MTEEEETVERAVSQDATSPAPGEEPEEWPLPVDDVERGAERMVEIESLLRDQRDAIEISVTRKGEVDDPPLTATVTGARRTGPAEDPERVVFTGVDDHDTRLEFSVPWPNDPTDDTEPLVRLLAWHGLSVDEFASIIGEPVPLRLDADGEVTVHVPPVPALGNDLWFRIKRWGMAKDLVTFSPGSLIRPGTASPYSNAKLWIVLLSTLGLVIGTLGLAVLPAVFTPSSAAAWLAYLLLVGLPSGLFGAIGVILLPLLVWVIGSSAYRWIKARYFPG